MKNIVVLVFLGFLFSGAAFGESGPPAKHFNEIYVGPNASDTNAGASGNITATGNALIAGTLSAGASTLSSDNVSGNEVIGGTLNVTGATTVSTLAASGVITENGGYNLPYTFAQSGIPIILPSSGSFANNGALTLTTALPNAAICSSPAGCYMYFPANSIASGVSAGVYYVVCSTTSACTVYNNPLSSGIPTVPASPTAFAVTGPGAYTQTTASYQNLLTLSLPPGAMGKSGALYMAAYSVIPNDSNAKNIALSFGGTGWAISQTTQNWLPLERTITNLGNSASQVSFSTSSTIAPSDMTVNGSAPAYLSVNTANSVTLLIQAQLATATDYVILKFFRFVVYPSN